MQLPIGYYCTLHKSIAFIFPTTFFKSIENRDNNHNKIVTYWKETKFCIEMHKKEESSDCNRTVKKQSSKTMCKLY